MKNYFRLWIVLLLFCLSNPAFLQDSGKPQQPQPAQNTPQLRANPDSVEKGHTNAGEKNTTGKNGENGADGFDWIKWGGWAAVVALLGIFVQLWMNSRAKIKDTERYKAIGKKEGEKDIVFQEYEELANKYRKYLKKELGKIHLLGHRDLDNIPLDLNHSFVNLNITETERSEEQYLRGRPEPAEKYSGEKTADDLLKDIFNRQIPLTVIIGEPGAGKTTIEKYFGLSCFDEDKCRKFGMPEDAFPIFLPFRELKFGEDGEPEKITIALMRIADKNLLKIDSQVFLYWLDNKNTLLLLDGLDEIGNPDHRKSTCKMIDRLVTRFEKAHIIVSCRGAVYSKEEGVYLNQNPLRADVKPLSLEQQEIFLHNWFYAVNRQEKYRDQKILPDLENKLRNSAKREAQPLIDYLRMPEHKDVQEMAGVPLMLQLIAFLWKNRRYKPDNARSLYQSTLLYILGDRDKGRGWALPMASEAVMEVLMPVALKMIEQYDQDHLSKEEWEKELTPELEKYGTSAPKAPDFLKYLYERSGLLAKYQEDQFIFKHKSFMEYLAAKQLREQWNYEGRMQRIVNYFGNKSWENTLQFFMQLSNADVFDKFMEACFQSEISKDLSQNERNLLEKLVQNAPQKKSDALLAFLFGKETSVNQKHYILEILQNIPTEATIAGLRTFLEKPEGEIPKQIREKAFEVLDKISGFQEIPVGTFDTAGSASGEGELLVWIDNQRFRNEIEYNAEYILIPGGKYLYQKGKKWEREVSVPDLYFAKYLVTNRRYRRFIRYLAGEESDLQAMLNREAFAQLLRAFAQSAAVGDPKYAKYLGDPAGWAEKLRSGKDEDKRFNGDDQPVVDVSWYAARGYCFWLSCLELAAKNKSEKIVLETAAKLYKLPDETEWEWAASGGKRTYPWGDDADHLEKRANFGNNVGATTPVGRYPDGATPAGLMDMAGNAWEWQENQSPISPRARSLRGGSWVDDDGNLRCSARNGFSPDYLWDLNGFRVLRSSP